MHRNGLSFGSIATWLKGTKLQSCGSNLPPVIFIRKDGHLHGVCSRSSLKSCFANSIPVLEKEWTVCALLDDFAPRLSGISALQQAVHRAQTLNVPLVILEPIGCRAKWSSVRFHQFVFEGMAEHHALCQEKGIAYHPYVEARTRQGVGLWKLMLKKRLW